MSFNTTIIVDVDTVTATISTQLLAQEASHDLSFSNLNVFGAGLRGYRSSHTHMLNSCNETPVCRLWESLGAKSNPLQRQWPSQIWSSACHHWPLWLWQDNNPGRAGWTPSCRAWCCYPSQRPDTRPQALCKALRVWK